MLKRSLITTLEGTKTLHISEWNESYHSRHGIVQEAEHVFLANGLNKIHASEITILEMGFGTGLNALLTLNKAILNNLVIHYYALEKYPININESKELNYGTLLDYDKAKEHYFLLHKAEWETEIEIFKNFYLTKFKNDFFELKNLPVSDVNLVYYDAFGARVQPYLWEERIFEQVFNTMTLGGLLTTYSSKGSARRAMESVGFKVEKVEGPIGKREMVNAWKI